VVIVLLPVAFATVAPFLAFVARVVVAIISAPFLAFGAFFYFYYRLFHEFATTGGAREFLRAVVICAIVTLLLLPLFPS